MDEDSFREAAGAILSLVQGRRGHFRFESGHHSNFWLELDTLFVRPAALRLHVQALARLIAAHEVEGVCGPLTGGAFLGQAVATELGCEFYFTERVAAQDGAALYGVGYRLPAGLHARVRGKRVAVVDDVISAGSAVRGTAAALAEGGATPVAVGALLLLGDAAPRHFAAQGIPVAAVAQAPGEWWTPAECPLCAAQIPLEVPAGG
jgi:orotate phosphoribosyltransferase